MRGFHLERLEDASGTSGTGWVAEGVQFANGKCVVSWLTKHTSIATYDDIDTLLAIHGHGGKTIVRMDGEVYDGLNCLGCHHPLKHHWADNCGGCSVGTCGCTLVDHPDRVPKEARP